MTAYDIAISAVTVITCVGSILMLLRMIWAELRSSLWTLSRMNTALEDLELSVTKLHRILDKIEAGTEKGNISE